LEMNLHEWETKSQKWPKWTAKGKAWDDLQCEKENAELSCWSLKCLTAIKRLFGPARPFCKTARQRRPTAKKSEISTVLRCIELRRIRLQYLCEVWPWRVRGSSRKLNQI
jgi:hypothetical protein